MSEINVEARDRYYAEVSVKLRKAGSAASHGSALKRNTASRSTSPENNKKARKSESTPARQ